MTQDMARYARKNEERIMESLDSIKESIGTIKTDLAVNTTRTGNIEEHLKTLNGKVQAHESRLQVQEGAVALNSSIIANLTDSSKATKTFIERNWEKFFWSVLALGWTYITTQ